MPSTSNTRARSLYRLDNSPCDLQHLIHVAALSSNTPIHAASDHKSIKLVEMSLASKNLLLHHLPKAKLITMPIHAEKNLDNDMKTLGHIAPSNKPGQDEYPVPYIFYGTLAGAEKLYAMLDLDEMPKLKEGLVKGGKIMKWGQYRALVDGTQEDEVRGCVFVVETKEQEDALCMYKGENYEVVRCKIEMGEEKIDGLTFRFCGRMGALTREEDE